MLYVSYMPHIACSLMTVVVLLIHKIACLEKPLVLIFATQKLPMLKINGKMRLA